jgi:Ca2+-binding EF-hand superfamily protein
MATAWAGLTTTSSDTYVKGEEKTITIAMPANCSAMNGTLVLENCTGVLSESFPSKEIDRNGNKFVVYGLNKDVMVGENLILKVTVSNNSNATVNIINCMGATPDAQAITIPDFLMTLTSNYDVNNDGILDAQDVIIVVHGIYDGDMSVVELQQIINALLDEM